MESCDVEVKMKLENMSEIITDFKISQIYELTPVQAQELCHKGYVFIRIDGKEHNKGEPTIRKYQFLGKCQKL